MLAVKRYANTRNETASKERLMVLLFETSRLPDWVKPPGPEMV